MQDTLHANAPAVQLKSSAARQRSVGEELGGQRILRSYSSQTGLKPVMNRVNGAERRIPSKQVSRTNAG